MSEVGRVDSRDSPVVGLSHAGIQVADIGRSIAFYERLGLRLAKRRRNGRPYIQRLVGHPGAELEIAIMEIPGSDSVLEILEYRDVPRTPIDPVPANPGTGHVCLLVEDLDALHPKLEAEGVEFVSEPVTPDIGPNLGGRVVYLKDPDGIRVELLQTTRTMTGAAR